MSYGIKNSIFAWWILVIIAVFLWCRNNQYDRMMAALAFVIALIQLVEYGLFNNMNVQQGNKLLFMLVWLVILILSLSVLTFTKNIVAFMWAVISSILFLVIVVYIFTKKNNDVPEIINNNLNYGYVIDDIYWLYITCFIVPFIILIYYCGADFYSMFMLFYVVLSMIMVYWFFGKKMFLSMWFYSLIGMIFICWIIGMYPVGVNK
jgi:hypothetical protein